jgi:hypothetical protein
VALGWLACDAPDPPGEASGCLGGAAPCDLPLTEWTLAGAHNAFNAGDSGFLVPNHDLGLAEQLAGGVRAFLMDTYLVGEGAAAEVVLCHGPCALGQQPLEEAAAIFAAFVRANPGEPLLWIVQDAAPSEATLAALEAAGLGPSLWRWEDEGWPTLGELAASGRSVMITAERDEPGPAAWTSFYGRGFDTAYTFAAPEDFSCAPLRGEPGQGLFLLNHWLSVPLPTREGAAEVNTRAALRARVDACVQEQGWTPNILAIDFWEQGEVVEVVRAMNEARLAARP